jgi:hypothetical protein
MMADPTHYHVFKVVEILNLETQGERTWKFGDNTYSNDDASKEFSLLLPGSVVSIDLSLIIDAVVVGQITVPITLKATELLHTLRYNGVDTDTKVLLYQRAEGGDVTETQNSQDSFHIVSNISAVEAPSIDVSFQSYVPPSSPSTSTNTSTNTSTSTSTSTSEDKASSSTNESYVGLTSNSNTSTPSSSESSFFDTSSSSGYLPTRLDTSHETSVSSDSSAPFALSQSSSSASNLPHSSEPYSFSSTSSDFVPSNFTSASTSTSTIDLTDPVVPKFAAHVVQPHTEVTSGSDFPSPTLSSISAFTSFPSMDSSSSDSSIESKKSSRRLLRVRNIEESLSPIISATQQEDHLSLSDPTDLPMSIDLPSLFHQLLIQPLRIPLNQ